MKIVEVARAGIFLALVMASYLIFKGTSNILNAILVPLFLYAAISSLSIKGRVALFLSLIILSAVINMWQIFFSFFYFLIAVIMYLTAIGNWKLPWRIILVSFFMFISFLISIRLTDLVFATRIEAFMLQLTGGSYLLYALIIALEGLVVGAALIWFAHIYDQKSKKWLL